VADDPKLVLLKWHADSAWLHELLRHEGWEKYADYLEKVTTQAIEALIGGTPPGPATDWQKGYIAGLRHAAQIPHDVIRNTGQAKVH
jgi:hypothetical protein